MPRQRVQIPSLPGRFAVGPKATQVSAYGRITPTGVQPRQAAFGRLGDLGLQVGRLLKKEADQENEEQRVRGAAHAERNPELVEQLQARVAEMPAGEADKALQALVAEGVVPEAAHPRFQIGFLEQVGRGVARSARESLMARLAELAAIKDADGAPRSPADVKKEIAAAYNDVKGRDVVRSDEFASLAFDAESIKGIREVEEAVTQMRRAAITEDHRSNFTASLGAAFARLRDAPADDVDGWVAEIERVAQTEGSAKAIRGLRLIAAGQVRSIAMELAATDVTTALEFVARAEAAQIGGVALKDDRSDQDGRGKMRQLRRDLYEEADNQDARLSKNRDRQFRDITRRALALGEPQILDALDRGVPTSGIVDSLIAAAQQDETIRDDILSLKEGDQMPQRITDELRTVYNDLIRDITHNELASSDPELIASIERRMAAGDTEDTLEFARSQVGQPGGITGQDYRALLARAAEGLGAASADLRKASPGYRTNVTDLLGLTGNRVDISSRFGAGAKADLVARQQRTINAVNRLFDEAVSAAAGDPGARQQAFDRVLHGEEVTSLVGGFQQELARQDQERTTFVAGIENQIRSYALDDAELALGALRGRAHDDTVRRLEEAISQRRQGLERSLIGVASDTKLNLLTELNALLGEFPEADRIRIRNNAASALEGALLEEGPEVFQQSSERTRYSAVRTLAQAKAEEILERFRSDVPSIGGGAAESIEEANARARQSANVSAWDFFKESIPQNVPARVLMDHHGLAGPRHAAVPPQVYDLLTELGRGGILTSAASQDVHRRRNINSAFIRLAPDDRRTAYLSVFGRDIIPAEAVISRTATVSSRGIHALEVRGLQGVTTTGAAGFSSFQAHVEVPLGDVKFPTRGVRYFEDISEFHALSPEDRAAFLGNLDGTFETQEDVDAFVAAQTYLIKSLQ